MPSASAKLEKQSSTDAFDPVKQVSTLLDNKVRNLEKRKGKLDGYKADFNSGKELNKDQLSAMEKYDQVLEVLDFSRDLQKNLKTIITDCQKHQKKASKREVADRQAEQTRRLKEVLLFQDLLTGMGTEQARQDFLNHTNGAVKLSEDELKKLDDLYKLICPERGQTDCQRFEEQLGVSAEHLLLLLESRPKEVLGTTYKSLKEILMRIHGSGYFDGGQVSQEDPSTKSCQVEAEAQGEEVEEEEEEEARQASPLPPGGEQVFQTPLCEMEQQPPADDLVATTQLTIPVDNVYFPNKSPENFVVTDVETPQQQQAPLTEVLHGQAPINFLQESQVDLESPLMDPAVVVAHPMAPPSAQMAYHSVPFIGGAPVAQPAGPQGSSYEPIPTQTFTNQNFANIVVAPATQYIPVNSGSNVNLLAGPAGIMTKEEAQQQQISPDLCLQKQEVFIKLPSTDFQQANLNNNELAQNSVLYPDDNEDNCEGFQTQLSNSNSRQSGYSRGGNNQRGPRGAPRSGHNNGYGSGRPRGPYNQDGDHTSGRGGYQGNYNNNRDYNSRRGGQTQRGGRGVARGAPHQQGAGRGANNYRTQSQMQQQ